MKVKHAHKTLPRYLQTKLTCLMASNPASIDYEESINTQMSGGKNQCDAVLTNQTARFLQHCHGANCQPRESTTQRTSLSLRLKHN